MRRLRVRGFVALAALVACSAVLAGAADSRSAAQHAFAASYRGNATALAPSVLMGTGPVGIALCPSFSGTASIVAKGGQVFGDVKPAKACRAKGTTYRGSGTAEILGGTGRFSGITGVVAYTATGDSATATFSLSLHGTITTGG